MAKKAKKKKKRKIKTLETLFKGNLNSIKKAINAAAKEVEKGRKRAVEQVHKGENSPIGSPAQKALTINREAVARAESMLMAFRTAKGLMAGECCNQDENCNFIVRSSTVGKAS